MNKTLIFIILIPLLFLANCSLPPPSPYEEMVDIGTHKLYLYCAGSGKPTIIIDTGLGETFDSWKSIIETLSAETRVCAYHRAGYGLSQLGPKPRDSQTEVDELHQLLVRSKNAGPLLLLGHSLGALNMQVFAYRYPDEVQGMVLIDPPPLGWMQGKAFPELREQFEQQMDELRRAADAASTSDDVERKANAAFLRSIASENEEIFGRTAGQVSEIRSFGEIPLTVIGATEPEPGFGEYASAYRQFWNDENRRLAKKSVAGKFLLAEGSSHHVHLDSPEIVLNAVLEMVE